MKELSDEQKKLISEKIGYFFDEIVLKYESKKYDENEYTELVEKYKNIKLIGPLEIDRALAWKYGKTLVNLPKNRKHQFTLNRVKDRWEEFTEKRITTGEDIFQYWFETLPTSFITAAFLAHLCKPNDVPIVDQHNFRAVRYFLSEVKAESQLTKNPKTWAEIYLVKDFIDTFSTTRCVSIRELDKYLMMFGKHVAPRS